MTDVIMIPLTKLVESEDNVRHANRKGGVSELASSIRSHGLLQSLVVRDTGKGKFAVIAGGRRLRALRLLAKAGDIEKNAPIPCRVIAGDDNLIELSLPKTSPGSICRCMKSWRRSSSSWTLAKVRKRSPPLRGVADACRPPAEARPRQPTSH